jgi:hypothetical protein
MTPEQAARLFANLFALLDSDQPGEREAALTKIIMLRVKLGWPKFVDLLRRLEDTVARDDFEAVERERDRWMRAHDDRVNENAALSRRNAAQAATIVTLRAALWFMINWQMVAGVTTAAVIGSGGWWWWSKAQAAPDLQPVAAAKDSARAAEDATLRDLLSRWRWGNGDAVPSVVRINGTEMWVIVRGTVDAHSHSDQWGRPIERHCMQLFAHEAARDAGAFVSPSPYLAFGAGMKWPLRAAECRMPGTRNYQ